MTDVIDRALRSEHARRYWYDVRLYVSHAVQAALQADVEPELLVAVGYVESRLRAVIGDQGRACGPYQHHVRYLRTVQTGTESHADACDRLLNSPRQAAETAAARLASYPHVCHYNQGERCREADLSGEAGTYSARVLSYRDTIAWSCWRPQ